MKNSCSHCRRAERQDAGEEVRLVCGKFNGRPYRAFLCADHLEMLCGDGLIPSKQGQSAGVGLVQARIAYRHALATISMDSAGIARLDELRARLWEAEVDALPIN